MAPRLPIIVGERGQMPARAYETSAGIDIFTSRDTEILPGQKALIPTDIAVAIPYHHVGLVTGRSSSWWEKDLMVFDGKVDPEYRGSLFVGVKNMGRAPYTVKRGERIAQLIVLPVVIIEMYEVDSLDNTDRGEGGFGSTG